MAGHTLHDLRRSPALAAEGERLERRCLSVHEEWAECELALGRGPAVVEELRELAERHPLRERLHAAWMTALHQSGRRSEALAVYDEYRQELARELGLEPGGAMADRYREVLSAARTHPTARPTTAAELPPDPTAFTGRGGQLRELIDALDRPGGEGGTVLLTGPAGSGKTALAVRAARLLADRYPDGCLLVRLRDSTGAARPATTVLDRLAASPGSPRPRRPGVAGWYGTVPWWCWTTPPARTPCGGCCRRTAGRAWWSPPGACSAVSRRSAGWTCRRWTRRRPSTCWPGSSARPASPPTAPPPCASCTAAGCSRSACGSPGCASPSCATCRSRSTRTGWPTPPAHSTNFPPGTSWCATGSPWPGATSRRPRPGPSPGWPPADRRALFTLAEAAAALDSPVREAVRTVESLIGSGAVTASGGEVTAHAAHYEVPRLTWLFARENAEGRTGRRVGVPG
ncbi:BTAD domain-containing putative transcriptional regulator [Actinomadura keratinilytica]